MGLTPRQHEIAGPYGRLQLHEWGGDGPGLLLVHGAGTHGRVWGPIAGQLIDTYQVFSVDLHHHGASARPSDRDSYSWASFGADVRAVTERFPSLRFAAGHSGGAAWSLLAAAQRHSRLDGLFCYEPPIEVYEHALVPDPSYPLVALTRRRKSQWTSLEEVRQAYRAKAPMAGWDEATFEAYLGAAFVPGPAGSVRLACEPESEALIYEERSASDLWFRLAAVTCPVTIAYGGRSSIVSPEEMAEAAERLPAGRLVEAAELSHFGPFEDPSWAAAEIRRAVEHALLWARR